MKALTVFVMVVFLAIGVVYAKDYEVTKKVEGYTILIKMDKNPPIAGNNNVEIVIKDASGKSITDAKVALNYSMPAMPGMPAMNYKADAVVKGDIYVAKANYSMPGSWNNELKIVRAGKTISARFTIDAK